MIGAAALALPATASATHNLTELTPAGDNTTLMSDDGSHVAFSTREALAAQDNDTLFDIYDWHHGITEQASVDENGQNLTTGQYALRAISPDGKHIVMDQTLDRLVAEDTDTRFDVYERFNGQTRWVSQGPLNPPTQFHAWAGRMLGGGSRLFFFTQTQLTPDDPDNCEDTYERTGGVTTLVYMYSPGCETAPVAGVFEAPLGDRYIFWAGTSLSPADTDTKIDYYEKYNGNIRLLTDGSGPDAAQDIETSGVSMSDQGERLFFRTYENLTPDDTDSPSSGVCFGPPGLGCMDTYEAYNGTLRLVTTGDADGEFLVRDEGEPGVASELGGHYYFRAQQRLTFDDTDNRLSLYEYANGVTTYIADAFAGVFSAASRDGSRWFFTTEESLSPQDTNGIHDVYERFNGTTTMLQPGSTSGTLLYGISKNADRVFFTTNSALVPSDTNGVIDLYERYNGNYYRIMRADSGPYDVDVSDDGTRLLVKTDDALLPSDTDSQVDYYRISVAPDAYARPKAATPINVAFVPAYAACASPNRVHAAPLSFNACAPPAQVSTFLTLGTPDANGAAAKSVASLRLLVIPGNPSTPANEAEARYEVSITDVRNSSDLTDYTGALKLDAALQITDRNNPDVDGGSPNATGSQPSFPVIVPCASTADTTVGSNCSITTTANTIAPGATIEGKRAIWETGQVRVSDGGADGNPATSGDGESLFLVQGVFIP